MNDTIILSNKMLAMAKAIQREIDKEGADAVGMLVVYEKGVERGGISSLMCCVGVCKCGLDAQLAVAQEALTAEENVRSAVTLLIGNNRVTIEEVGDGV